MILAPEVWQALASEHERAAEELTADHRARRSHHIKHPVYDFLFEYYPFRPAQLHKWHPGLGRELVDPEHRAPQRSWHDYRVDGERVSVDTQLFLARRGESVRYIRTLLDRTRTNPTQFDCFGLHEWAMVYRAEGLRHDLPLRLGARGTDRVVETHRLRCTHYDAFRFFTPAARPLNLTVLEREDQPNHDQPGCVHATMDLYKWAAKLGPLVRGEWFLEAFRLACDARVLDMEASPYDCRGLGLSVVAIETPEGKAEYVRRQRELAHRASDVRRRLVAVIDEAFDITMSS